MKVIILVDDKKLGKKNSIVEVADGYARNVLIPKKIVVEATNENLNHLSQQLSSEKYLHDKLESCALAQKQRLENEIKSITINLVTDNKTGKVFGSITSKDIEIKLNELGEKVDKHSITLPMKVIKEPGVYTVGIKLFESICANIIVEVK